MAETPFRISVDPPLEKVDRDLATFARLTADLRPFWAELGRSLADETERRWPLKRKSGRLRRSLTWARGRLGRGGIYRSRPDRLIFGTRLFYADFSQRGTTRQATRELIHVREDEITTRLTAWAVDRAKQAGLEATA